MLDEPNANLDGPGEEALKVALLQAKTDGAAVIVITHRTTILDIVDIMMVLRNGMLDMLGPPGEVYQALQQQATARAAAS